jgi:predicted peroxiredoxin
MIRFRSFMAAATLIGLLGAAASFALAQDKPGKASSASAAVEEPATVVLNITSGPSNLVAVVTAFRIAEEAIADHRRVVLLFSLEGVNVPLKRFPPELRVGRERPVWRMLDDLVNSGAEVIVGRASLETMGLYDADFIPAAKIEPYAGNVFSRMSRNTTVFSF